MGEYQIDFLMIEEQSGNQLTISEWFGVHEGLIARMIDQCFEICKACPGQTILKAAQKSLIENGKGLLSRPEGKKTGLRCEKLAKKWKIESREF